MLSSHFTSSRSSFASPCHSLVHPCYLTSTSPILHHTFAASASSSTYTSTYTTASAPLSLLRGLVRNAPTIPRTAVGTWMYLSCASCSCGVHQQSHQPSSVVSCSPLFPSDSPFLSYHSCRFSHRYRRSSPDSDKSLFWLFPPSLQEPAWDRLTDIYLYQRKCSLHEDELSGRPVPMYH